MRRLLVPLLLLSACAGPRTHDLMAECWQEDPASVWVVENALSTRADSVCRDGWTLLGKTEVKEATHKEIHWNIACNAGERSN